MKQPKNELSLTDDRDTDFSECIVTIENYESGDFGMLAIGRTPRSAYKAAIRRLKRLTRDAEAELAKIEKGGE